MFDLRLLSLIIDGFHSDGLLVTKFYTHDALYCLMLSTVDFPLDLISFSFIPGDAILFYLCVIICMVHSFCMRERLKFLRSTCFLICIRSTNLKLVGFSFLLCNEYFVAFFSYDYQISHSYFKKQVNKYPFGSIKRKETFLLIFISTDFDSLGIRNCKLKNSWFFKTFSDVQHII